MKRVSVIVPVYNKEKELKQCLNSIIQQTYTELEIVIIDDGSKDRSLSICKKIGEIDKRVRVYSKINEGVEKARLFGIEKARGDYIMFVDSDDWLAKNAIEVLVKTLEKNDADVSFAASTRVLDSRGIVKRKYISEIYKQGVIEHDEFVEKHLQSFSGCGTFPINLCGKIYKNKLLKDINIEPVGLAYGEDLCLNLQVLPKARKIVGCPEALYYYRWGGVTTNVQERVFLDAVKQYEYKIPYYLRYGRKDCVEKSNIELINYFYTYVDACVLKYEKDLQMLIASIDKALRNEVFQNAVKAVKREQIVSQDSYQAIVNKDVQKIISLKRSGIKKKKMKRIAMNITHSFLR